MLKTAVVILNWNGRTLLQKFLPSVISNSKVAEVIIADNCSADDSIQWLSENYPQIKVIQNKQNDGFAKGYNIAINEVDSDIIVLLNSDVEVQQDWLTSPLKRFENDSSIAAIQPKIKSEQNRDYFEYAGAAGGMIDKFGFPFCRGRIFEHLEKDHGQYDTSSEIFWASGACLFIRTELFKSYGGFDERFFAHMEEIDLCWRLKNAGHKIIYDPDSVVYHVGGGTLNKVSPRKTFLNFRNNLLMMHKNLPKGKLFSHLFIKMGLDGLAALRFLFTGAPSHMWAVIKAHFAFYTNLQDCIRIRRNQNASLLQKYPSMVYGKSIVSEVFLFGKKKFTELDQEKFNSI